MRVDDGRDPAGDVVHRVFHVLRGVETELNVVDSAGEAVDTIIESQRKSSRSAVCCCQRLSFVLFRLGELTIAVSVAVFGIRAGGRGEGRVDGRKLSLRRVRRVNKAHRACEEHAREQHRDEAGDLHSEDEQQFLLLLSMEKCCGRDVVAKCRKNEVVRCKRRS